MKRQESILIAGGGPVGLTAGVELFRRGFAPDIIDNDGEPTSQSRALVIHARTLDILEPSGATEALLSAGNRINGMIMRTPAREIMQLDFSDLPHRFNFILALPQSRTEEILIGTLRALGGDVNWFNALTDFSVTENKVISQIDVRGQHRSLETDYLIGADGAHSGVRKGLNMGFDGERDPEEFGLADVELDDWPFPLDRAVAILGDGEIFGCFPYGGNQFRFVMNRSDLLNRLPREAKIRKVNWESTFKISYRQVQNYRRGPVFLAGDAAHIHSPVGGRGMNLGIEDAATLAWLLETGQLDRYSAMRHPIGEQVLRFTAQQTRMMMSSSVFNKALARFIAPVAMKLPYVRRAALMTLTGLDTPGPQWL